MQLARLLRISAMSVGVLAAMAVIGVFAWLWLSHLPNEAARKLEALYASRPALPDADNAFLDVYGFSAPVGTDPHAHGARRIAWLRKMHRDPENTSDDPGESDLEFGKLRSREARQIFAACHESRALACGEAFAQSTADQPLHKQEELLRSRYQRLLGRAGWREEMWYSVSDPLPRYTDVLDAQRLTLIRLRSAAQRGETAVVRDALQRDLVFWRMVQKSTDGLIGKMIAVAAVRNHFTFANLVLRELPPDRVLAAIPPTWLAPLGDEERSMWRVLAGEYSFARTAVRDMYESGDSYSDDEYDIDAFDRVLGQVRRRVEPPRMLNEVALAYGDVAREFEVPLSRYLQANGAVIAAGRDQDNAKLNAQYALRVGSIEGMRRVALLTAQLRSRSVAAVDVEAELRKSELRTPFEEAPFTWDAAQKSIAYEGPMESRRALVLLY